MISQKKILFIINTVTPYQLDFFNKLSKNVNLRVIFHSKDHVNYKFNFRKKNNHFFLSSQVNQVEYFCKFINNFKPNLVIFGGYRLPHNSKFISYIKKKKIKFFYWLEKLNENNFLKYHLIKRLIGNKINSSNGVLAVGKKAKKIYSKYNKNTFNFPYSIKIKKLNKKKYFKNNKINFLFVGQLIQRKGIKEILSAINKLSCSEKEKILIHIVGDGGLKKLIEKYQQRNVAIKYYGFVFGNKLSKIYQSSDVLLFPSKFDGWGVVPMEAMANSMSVVVSKNAGVSEILNSKNNGFLIEPKSSALLNAIKKCIKNKKIIIRHGKNNRNLIFESICNADNLSNYFLKQIMKNI